MIEYEVAYTKPGHECNAWCRPPQHCDTLATLGLTYEEVYVAYRKHCKGEGWEFVSIERTHEAQYKPIMGFWPDAVWLLTWRQAT